MANRLIRRYFKSHTYGILVVNGIVFCTLEPPWKKNRRNVSCVPAGVYKVSFLARSASGKYRNVWHIEFVPKRSGILIHNGNLTSHTRGCVLVGLKFGRLGGKPAVLSSRTALRRLLKAAGKKPFTLVVR